MSFQDYFGSWKTSSGDALNLILDRNMFDVNLNEEEFLLLEDSAKSDRQLAFQFDVLLDEVTNMVIEKKN